MGLETLERESSGDNGRFSDPDPDLGIRISLIAAASDEAFTGKDANSQQVRNGIKWATSTNSTQIRCDSKNFQFTIAKRDRVEICEQTRKRSYRMWVNSEELSWIGSCFDSILLRIDSIFHRQTLVTGNRKLSLTYNYNPFGFCVNLVEERKDGRTSIVIPEGRGRFNLKLFRAQIRSIVSKLGAKCKNDFFEDLCLSYEPIPGKQGTVVELRPSCCLAQISRTDAVEAPSPSRLMFIEELKRAGWWVDTEARRKICTSPTVDEEASVVCKTDVNDLRGGDEIQGVTLEYSTSHPAEGVTSEIGPSLTHLLGCEQASSMNVDSEVEKADISHLQSDEACEGTVCDEKTKGMVNYQEELTQLGKESTEKIESLDILDVAQNCHPSCQEINTLVLLESGEETSNAKKEWKPKGKVEIPTVVFHEVPGINGGTQFTATIYRVDGTQMNTDSPEFQETTRFCDKISTHKWEDWTAQENQSGRIRNKKHKHKRKKK